MPLSTHSFWMDGKSYEVSNVRERQRLTLHTGSVDLEQKPYVVSNAAAAVMTNVPEIRRISEPWLRGWCCDPASRQFWVIELAGDRSVCLVIECRAMSSPHGAEWQGGLWFRARIAGCC
jgi:hypothetical protein